MLRTWLMYGGGERRDGKRKGQRTLSHVIYVLDIACGTMVSFNCHSNPVNLVLCSGIGAPPSQPHNPGDRSKPIPFSHLQLF